MIILNRWYRINSKEEAERFINYVVKNFNIEVPNSSKYFDAQMLKLVKTKPGDAANATNEPYWISWRSKFSENELNDNPALSVESIFKNSHTITPKDILTLNYGYGQFKDIPEYPDNNGTTLFVKTLNRQLANSTYGKCEEIKAKVIDDEIMYKGEIEMEKMADVNKNKIQGLIDDYYSNEVEECEKKFDKVREQILKNSYIGKAAQDFVNVYNTLALTKVGQNNKKEYKEFVYTSALTEEEIKSLADNDKNRAEKLGEIHATRKELIALLSITETYDQRIKLLKKYGVIK